MARIFSVESARARARRRLPRIAFDFIDGGAEDEVTMRSNRAAFEDLRLRPRYLEEFGPVDCATTVLGTDIAFPVGVSPTGLPRMAGRGGEVAGARAAGRAGTLFIVPTLGNFTLEQVAAAASGPLWFQLYLWPDRDAVAALVDRVRRAGYRALVLTVDTTVLGNRERDVRNGFDLPPRPGPQGLLDLAVHPRWLRSMLPLVSFPNVRAAVPAAGGAFAQARAADELLTRARVTAGDIRWLREQWDGPLVIKGIVTGEDARRAVALGADGVIVSNHGGRQLDGAPASIVALDEVARSVGDEVEVFLDSGIRRGADVVKALALGARACFVGRPWLYGLAAGGEDGVVAVLRSLREELERTLALVGRPSVGTIDRSLLWS